LFFFYVFCFVVTELEQKEKDIKQKSKVAKKAKARANKMDKEYRKEKHDRQNAETLKDQKEEEFNREAKEGAALKSVAKELRLRSKEGSDDQRESYEHLSDEELIKALQEDEENFRKEQEELNLENLSGQEGKELKNQSIVAAEFDSQWQKLNDLLRKAKTDKDREEILAALEQLEEYGEQNEVFLDHLKRDAEENKGEWKERTRPKNMHRLMRKMDDQAEVLRVKQQVKGLVDTEEALKKIKSETRKMLKKHADPMAQRVKGMVIDVAERERRLKLELLQADDMEAYQQAKALEEYSVEVQKQVADLEQLAKTNSSHMTDAEKREHREALDYFEKELQEIETQAQEIEKGFERRDLRRNVVLLSKEANQLDSVKGVKKLKHGEKVLDEVAHMLRTESGLLDNMKYHDNKHRATQRQQAQELKDQDDEFEEDAKLLYGEANAGDFEKLDDKIDAKNRAKALENQGEELQDALLHFERNQDEDDVRSAAHNMDLEGRKMKNTPLRKLEPQWQKASLDAKQLEQAIGEDNWDDELKMSDDTVRDINALEVAADELQTEMEEGSMSKKEKRNYIEAIKEMRGHASRLREYAQGVKSDVGDQASREASKLRKKEAKVKPFLRKEKPIQKQPRNSMRQ
jgi:hypothetical protein